MYSFLSFCLLATPINAFPDLFRRQFFDPASQHIDVSNAHAYIAPGPTDLRGPCPAMNAVANHGYIARNGYTNFQEAITAIMKVYGVGQYLLHCGIHVRSLDG